MHIMWMLFLMHTSCVMQFIEMDKLIVCNDLLFNKYFYI